MSTLTRSPLEHHVHAAQHLAGNLREIKDNPRANPLDAMFPDITEYYEIEEAALALYLMLKSSTIGAMAAIAKAPEATRDASVLTMAVILAGLVSDGLAKPRS